MVREIGDGGVCKVGRKICEAAFAEEEGWDSGVKFRYGRWRVL